jgi:hypothetical protein
MKSKTVNANDVKLSGNGAKTSSVEVKKEDDFVARMTSVRKRKANLEL